MNPELGPAGIRRLRGLVLCGLALAGLLLIAATSREATRGHWGGTLIGLGTVAWQFGLVRFTIAHFNDGL